MDAKEKGGGFCGKELEIEDFFLFKDKEKEIE